MTASTHPAAPEVPAQMPRSAEPGQAAAAEGQTVARAGATVGRRALQQLGENPLQTLFGAALVALLMFNLTATNDRITRLEERMDARFAQVDARFAALEEDIAKIEEDIAEINLKLTAIIAALNMTEEVTAALEGRLIAPTPAPDPANTGTAPG